MSLLVTALLYIKSTDSVKVLYYSVHAKESTAAPLKITPAKRSEKIISLIVRPLWPAGGNRRATDEEVEYSSYMYLSMLEWSWPQPRHRLNACRT